MEETTVIMFNHGQKKAVTDFPELVEEVSIMPSDGSVWFRHLFYKDPFYAGTLSADTIPVLSRIAFRVKSWKIEGDDVKLNIELL